MALTREDLENDILRRTYEGLPNQLPLVSASEFDDSLKRMLAATGGNEDVWVFGYGSLIWNPLFHYVERGLASVHGFHRSFCLRSRLGRGSLEQPGLVLGLDFGGSCQGMAFRIEASQVRQELKLIWRREMVLGSYAPRWVNMRVGTRRLRGLAFIVNHQHPHYAGKLPLDTVVTILASAHGKFGTSADYLHQTVDCLASHGIHDAHLAGLSERVRAATGTEPHRMQCPEVGA